MAEPRKKQPESPKRFMKQVLARGPYYELLNYLSANPNFGVSGRVWRSSAHYVHWNSTSVELETDGYFGDGDAETDVPEEVVKLVDRVADDLKEQIVKLNRELEHDLQEELDFNQSDEAISEWMDTNDWRFTSEGEQVDMEGFVPVDNLQPGIRQKVLARYADLFERTPEQVYASLMKRKLLFDKRGNQIDTSDFKTVSELEPKVRSKILDKYRNILVDDDFWAESENEHWTEKLEEMGFGRVDIAYSLGGMQGDGASFTADTIDVPKLCKAMLGKATTEAQATELVLGVLQ